MASRFKNTSQPLPAFILLGIAIALVVGLFIVFAYVLLWGIILGSLLWVCSLIKQKWFKPTPSRQKGRIIDYEQ
jgi:hypothetical protein